MSQSEVFHETWAYLRDNAKPVVPHDVYDLMVVRADMPPSKAHIKRIMSKSRRPLVNVIRPPAAPDRWARAAKCEAIKLGMQVKRLVAPNLMAKASPLPRRELAPMPPVHETREHFEQRKCTRLKRDHMLAMAKMVYTNYQPALADILEAFGTVEAWEKAKEKA